MSYSRYHPSKGYTWELKGSEKVTKKEVQKEEPSSLFQRHRVDMLLGELTHKFPLPVQQPPSNKPSQPERKSFNAKISLARELSREYVHLLIFIRLLL